MKITIESSKIEGAKGEELPKTNTLYIVDLGVSNLVTDNTVIRMMDDDGNNFGLVDGKWQHTGAYCKFFNIREIKELVVKY